MHPFLEPLDNRGAMLLLTTLTVGGSHETDLFAHLPRESRTRLEDRARSLLDLPPEKRVPFMVREMKLALSHGGLRGLERVDASWIVEAMKGEAPRTVAAILVDLPGPAVRAVLALLPPGVRGRLPPREEVRRLRPELLRSVRRIFEERFAVMPEPSRDGFAFRDVIRLERGELHRLVRDLGLVELGQAFVAVGRVALAELCRRLPRHEAEALVAAVRSASRVDAPHIKEAQRLLSRVATDFADSEELLRRSGLWRLARASLVEDAGFRAGFRQRLPLAAGRLYERYAGEAEALGEVDVARIERLQDTVLLRVRDLARDNVISPAWSSLHMLFHAPPAEEDHAAARLVSPDDSGESGG